MDASQAPRFGDLAPGRFDRAILAVTRRLPAGWLGHRLSILLRRFVTMRLPSGALDVESFGMRMRLHPLDSICEKAVLFTPQMFDLEERSELCAEIERVRAAGATFYFVDIGANVGAISLFVASQTGRSARILAVEPAASIFARLTFNLAANPGAPIQAFRLALADGPGEMAIEFNYRNIGGTRTQKPTDLNSGLPRVPCCSLLQFLQDQGLERIDALKIDVEGMEDVVLIPFFRDAPRSLWPRLIVIEDGRELWSTDVIAELAGRYEVSSRSRYNLMLRLVPRFRSS
jgi:FkbM family methyltransferase